MSKYTFKKKLLNLQDLKNLFQILELGHQLLAGVIEDYFFPPTNIQIAI